MKAHFEIQGHHDPVIVIEPEHGTEAILTAAFIRFDSNVFRVRVERYEDGQIQRLILEADGHE